MPEYQQVTVMFPIRVAIASMLLLPLAGCKDPAAAPKQSGGGAAPTTTATTAPAVSRAAATGEWPAFHGGGGLRGVGEDIGTAPLALRWQYRCQPGDVSPIEGSAAIVGGVVYIGDGTSTLHAIDVHTGKRKWAYKAEDGFAATPLVADGNVVIGDLTGTMHCVAAADGTKRWTFDGGAAIHSSANLARTAAGARVVFGTDGANIYCLNLADGAKVWEQTAGDRINGAPGIGWGAAFVSGCDAKLRAIQLDNGSERFSTDIGALCPGSPAILDDRIIMGTDGGKVVAYSPDGQKQLWTFEGIADGAMVYGSPAVADGIAVVGARDRRVYALDAATGKRLWDFTTRGDVDSAPAISGGRVFVGSRDKNLYVLDLKTGKPLGEFPAGRAIVAGPAVGEGVVVVGDGAGNVYCYEPR